MNLILNSSSPLCQTLTLPGDKSISHRALMLAALAEGTSEIHNFLPSGDCLATLNVLRQLGVYIEQHTPTHLTVRGRGLQGLCPPTAPLNCVRSGTTMRLMCGILAGQPFDSCLTGDEQLLRRPMRRVTAPLREMGAQIQDQDGYAPLTLSGRPLHGFEYHLPIASAQVKSALLLAALYANGPVTLEEPGPSRDHTERMLQAQLVHPEALQIDGRRITLDGRLPNALRPLHLNIPGDFSSAAFLLVAGALIPGSQLTLSQVGLNPTRTGLLDVLRAMGAQVEVHNQAERHGEPVGDLVIRYSQLQAVTIRGDMVVRMIDEFPILAVAATQAQGQTVVHDAHELRVKETDRIVTVVQELRKMGANLVEQEDGFVVRGPTPLHGALVDSHGDHRLAMALAVAARIARGETTISRAECMADSFPGFQEAIGGTL